MPSQQDSKQELSSALLVEKIQSKFEDYRKESQHIYDEYRKLQPSDKDSYSFTRSSLFKKIYLETKQFFDDYQNDLTPTDKKNVFEKYIKLWHKESGELDILDTDYSEQYKSKQFTKYRYTYCPYWPMLAGFNLKNIDFGGFDGSDLVFLAVNFTGTNFNQMSFSYASFHGCDFTGSDLRRANFNQCIIERCNLEGIDLSHTDLWAAQFEQCILSQTKPNTRNTTIFKEKCFYDNLLTASRDGKLIIATQLIDIFPELVHSRDLAGNTPLHLAAMTGQIEIVKLLLSSSAKKNAVNKDGELPLDLAKKYEHNAIAECLSPNPPYPFFLQHLKVKSKYLTAEKVANALWLSDKELQSTELSKAEFSLWAKKQDLSFNQNDVDKYLASYTLPQKGL